MPRLAGIVVLCLTGDDGDPDGPQHNTLRGIFMHIGAAVGFATHILLLTHFGKRLAIVPFTFWQLTLTAGLASALVGYSGLWATSEPVHAVELSLAVAYMGVLATAIAIAVQARVQPRIPPLHVALLFALQPLFAAFAGWLFQGDRLGTWQWLGGGLIVGGVVVTGLDRS